MAADSSSLALWGYLLFGGSLVSRESLLAMTDFRTDTGDDGYGLGVFDQTELAQGFHVQAVGNGGWDEGGYSSVLTVLPSEGVAISVMTNTAGDPRQLVMPVAQELASAIDR
jgi:CubicO group peptidase (beta-lactamase class C family)